MPNRAQLLSELGGVEDYGILLLGQIGGAPNEVQLLIETTVYDEAAQGLRPRHTYAVRALGVREQRLSLGVFGRLQMLDDHPLLLHHNAPKVAVHFSGRPAHAEDLVLDVSQAYVSTFGPWRHLIEQEDDLNRSAPLLELLQTGAGQLGIMPAPLAERMVRVLQHHGLTASLAQQADFETEDEHGRSRLARLLLIDQSYIVALDFSVEAMGAG
ncbi:MAG TPA: hypothetical protein VER79_03115 [Candidatus Limnocylindrales bacterium]|nr:hypothetical protein [Candidatus Limnocylindrales bacterium]